MFGRNKSEPDAPDTGRGSSSSSTSGPDTPRPPAKAPVGDRGPASSSPDTSNPTSSADQSSGGRTPDRTPSDAKPSVAPRDTPRTTRPADPVAGRPGDKSGDDKHPDDKTAGPAKPAPGMTAKNKVRRTRVSGWWFGLVVAAILAVFLLIFIAQNSDDVAITFLGWQGQVPLAVAMLAGAVVAVLIVAVPGSLRIAQLRRALRKNVKNAS